MKYILGVDAAWTDREPTGVALLGVDANGLTLIKLSRSYEEFSKCKIDWNERAAGSQPALDEVLKICKANGCVVDLIALDIPLSPEKIVVRRECDSQISRIYGKYGAATHSPSEQRPGVISELIFRQLLEADYKWNGSPEEKTFIEVYPHTAIIELFDYNYRLPYKVKKRTKYWANDTPHQRNLNIITNLNELRLKITECVPNAIDFLPLLNGEKSYTTTELKGYEDCLDAIICTLVGAAYLSRNANGFGDRVSTIWVPKRANVSGN